MRKVGDICWIKGLVGQPNRNTYAQHSVTAVGRKFYTLDNNWKIEIGNDSVVAQMMRDYSSCDWDAWASLHKVFWSEQDVLDDQWLDANRGKVIEWVRSQASVKHLQLIEALMISAQSQNTCSPRGTPLQHDMKHNEELSKAGTQLEKSNTSSRGELPRKRSKPRSR